MNEYPKVMRMPNGVSLKNKDGSELIAHSKEEEDQIKLHSFIVRGPLNDKTLQG